MLPPGREAIERLDQLLGALSGEPFLPLWLDNDALLTAPEWIDVRRAAREALDALGAPDGISLAKDAVHVIRSS